jgi:hypothetical protein
MLPIGRRYDGGMESKLLLAAVPMLAFPLAAQVFVVDANNGPGANFTTITAAVAAVPSGAVLRVLPGNYDGFSINGKSLTVLNEGGQIAGPLGAIVAVANIAATQSVVLRGLVWPSSGGLTLSNCSGFVACHECSVTSRNYTFDVSISQCRQVHLVDCLFQQSSGTTWSVVHMTSSDAVFERCRLFGGMFCTGLDVHGGRAQLVSCGIAGGINFSPPAGPGVHMTQADMRVLGGMVSGGLAFSSGWAFAIDGSGTLRIDPSTVLQSTPQPISPTLSPQFAAMPILEASHTRGPGAAIKATLNAPAGWFGALYIGFPALPAASPGFVDEVWIDPATAVVLTSGLFASPQLRGNVAVPNADLFFGTRLACQGVTFDATAGLQLSNPAAITIW